MLRTQDPGEFGRIALAPGGVEVGLDDLEAFIPERYGLLRARIHGDGHTLLAGDFSQEFAAARGGNEAG